jgi:hypothetical protein
MRDERVRVSGSVLSLLVEGHEVDRRRVEEASRLYVVAPENTCLDDDEPFYVAVLGLVVWVIPYFTPGIDAVLAAIHPVLEARRGVTRVENGQFPWSWRRRFLGFFPLLPLPELGCHPLSSLPSWASERGDAGALQPGALKELQPRGGTSLA